MTTQPQHKGFLSSIGSGSEPLRRYMDFSKFVSSLDRGELFFPTAASLPDRAEGLPHSKKNLMSMKAIARLIKHHGYESQEDYEAQTITAEFRNKLQEYRKKFVAISSWNATPHESYGMWKSYLTSNEGVCIVSTRERLKLAIKDPRVIFRDVSYDRATGDVEPEYLAPFFRKSNTYAFEHEFRALINCFEKYGESEAAWEEEEFKNLVNLKGVFVPIDRLELIESIVVSPFAKPWFKELVENVSKKYCGALAIHDSELEFEFS